MQGVNPPAYDYGEPAFGGDAMIDFRVFQQSLKRGLRGV